MKNNIVKDQLTRIKQLFNYNFDGTFITEEMQVSDDFNKNEFIEDKEQKIIYLGVGVDKEDNVDHQIFLVIRFIFNGVYEELIFYFSLLNKNNQFVKGKENIYNREEVDKYLPKELQKSIIFFGKLKEMFKILITMETPDIFFMETYEDFVSERLLNPYRNLIPIILKNGYILEEEGLSFDKKKYHWKFVKKTKQQLKESKELDKKYKNFKKDDEYWRKLNEENIKIFENSRKRGLFDSFLINFNKKYN